MKVAAPYTHDWNYQELPDEFNIIYSDTSTTEKLLNFCELFPDRRINVTFQDVEINYSALRVAKKVNQNVAVVLPIEKMSEVDELTENDIQFFFSTPCSSFSLLDAMVGVGVSDIYIYDELCYWMKDVRRVCDLTNIQIRMVVNTIPSNSPFKGILAREPIYSPRDFFVLEKYIDVFEFDCGRPYEWGKFDVYYRAWLQEHDWWGDLAEINIDLDFDYPIKSQIPNIAERKVNCHRVCSKGTACHSCDDMVDIAKSLDDDGYWLQMLEKEEMEQQKFLDSQPKPFGIRAKEKKEKKPKKI